MSDWEKDKIIDELVAENATLRQQLADKTAECEGLREDAERWRYWKTKREVSLVTSMFGNGCVNKTVEMAEELIDAARKEG